MIKRIIFLAIFVLYLALLIGCPFERGGIDIESAGTNVDLNNNAKIDAQFLDDHATLNHAVGASDSVFPADPGADRFLMWDDSESSLSWEEAVLPDSPALTGVPTAPTAAEDTNTTQIATTAFVETATEPAQLLTDIKTVDGTGSGLDGDTVDGLEGSQFVRSDTDDTMDGVLTVTGTSQGQIAVERDTSGNYIGYAINDESSNPRWQLFGNNNADFDLYLRAKDAGDNDVFIVDNDTGVLDFQIQPTISGNAILYNGATGIDADLLDGIDSTGFSLTGHAHDDMYYTESEIDTLDATVVHLAGSEIITGTKTFTANQKIQNSVVGGAAPDTSEDDLVIENTTGGMTITSGNTGAGIIAFGDSDASRRARILYNHSTDELQIQTQGTDPLSIGTDGIVDFQNVPTAGGNNVLTTADTGSGNGLDADLLDGIDSSSFMRNDTNNYFNSDLTLGVGTTSASGSTQIFHSSGQNRFGIRPYYSGSYNDSYSLSFDADDGYWKIGSTGTDRLLTAGDTGSGNGLDADTVDGLEASQFLRSDIADQVDGVLTFDVNPILNNTKYLQGKESGGTARNIAGIDGSNNVEIGSANNALELLSNGALTHNGKPFGVTTPSPGSDHTVSGDVVSMTVGESVVFGDFLYIQSDGKLWKSDADASTSMPIFAMATDTCAADAACDVLTEGFARDDSWTWTVGGISGTLYGSETAGAITQTAPAGTGDQIQIVGMATAATRIYFKPNFAMSEI